MPTASPRRSPDADDRIRDAERTKQRLLEAAFDEFAERGYAGARVSSIADRAGVNKQLISYYFGGKPGLHRELLKRWTTTEQQLRASDASIVDVVTGYLRHALQDPRGTRFSLWQALGDAVDDSRPADRSDIQDAERASIDREQDDLRVRQRAGELPDDLDLPSAQLAFTGMVIAPIVQPGLVAALFDEPADSPAFADRYCAAVAEIVRRLGTQPRRHVTDPTTESSSPRSAH